MLGAICGDVIGAPYERRRYAIKHKDFPLFCEYSRFTDDTILTLAVGNAILRNVGYLESVVAFATEFPRKGYGGRFRQWLRSGTYEPYASFGNGSAMRVSPVGWAFDDETRVLAEAARSAEITHNHPEGIKG
ncbi:MAG: ADP-ribosylglycohydrolase family protein, partial [Candidatus Dadabacteria bacterium]